MSDTIAAIATGAQVAAIGVLRLSGAEAIRCADALFEPLHGRPLREREDRRLVYGKLKTRAGDVLDLCLATVSRAPHSYTGEDTAEFQCHGSPVVLRAALEELFALGARQAGPGEFTRRAFLNGRMDLSSAEAVADLIESETAEAARNAAGQLSGAIAGRIGAICETLTDISAHYHAVLDYPDEDIEDFRLAAYRGALEDALGRLRTLRASFGRGQLLRSGIPTVLVGRPNAGKSSLLNALLGYDRAIVTEIPGTTRDTIEEKLRLGGLLLRLTDTAGIRAAGDAVERLGVERSRAALEQAELVLLVIDGSEDFTPEDAALLRERRGPGGAGARDRRALPAAGGPGGGDPHERPAIRRRGPRRRGDGGGARRDGRGAHPRHRADRERGRARRARGAHGPQRPRGRDGADLRALLRGKVKLRFTKILRSFCETGGTAACCAHSLAGAARTLAG